MSISNDKFFFTGSEPKSDTRTNFQSFVTIFSRKSPKTKNTSFKSSVIRFEAMKKNNPEVARAKAESQARRERYQNAAKNYLKIIQNPKAKIKQKGGLRYIETRDSQGKFTGKEILL